jgi:branched-chain amino acid transport system ATP-binding protein
VAEALSLQGVWAGYGPTQVLEGVTLEVGASTSISIVGRNGVGKSTLLNTVMGHTTLHRGAIRLGDRDITRLAVHRRALAGLGYVPQEREIFPSLSVMENLTIGEAPGRWTQEAVFDLFPILAERRDNMGNQLSGGEQQMLSIARALITNPSVLLMDEPSEGLAPIIVEELVRILGRLRESGGITLILVEQNTRIAFEFSDRTVVLDRGRVTYDGDSETLRSDKEMLDSLIGVSA